MGINVDPAGAASNAAACENFSLTFSVSKETQLASVSQFFFILLGWRWIGVVSYLLVGVTLLWWNQAILGTIFVVIGGVLVALWAKSYFSSRAQSLSQLALLNSNAVTIEFSEHGFMFSCDNSTRSIGWEQINRVEESRDFIFLLNNKLHLLTVPRAQLPRETVFFLRSLAS